jgi:ABC-type multidrug transport system ATPase subunit
LKFSAKDKHCDAKFQNFLKVLPVVVSSMNVEKCSLHVIKSPYLRLLNVKSLPVLSDSILSINGLTKHFGRIRAVEDLTLEVKRGEVYGILGPNGSGKTTTLGMILGVVHATRGIYMWFGEIPTHESRKRIGAILEQPIFYPYLSAAANLKIIAQIKNSKDYDIDNSLTLAGLYDRRHSMFRTFSYGMRQRLAIAAALLCSPEVLILDEPTNGLDPQGIAEVRDMIKNVATTGMTVILASHLLDEVQKTCSHVCVLEKGKKLFSGKVDDVLNETVMLEIAAANMALLKATLKEFQKMSEFREEHDKLVVKLAPGTTAEDLNAFLFGQGVILSHLALHKKSLEKYFLELLEKPS